MKHYFINNYITKIALPQGYAVSTDFNERHKAFVELTQEQVEYHLANPTTNHDFISEFFGFANKFHSRRNSTTFHQFYVDC